MTPRRLGLLFSMAALAAIIPRFVLAEGTKYLESAPVFQSEGSNPVVFEVSCATATWTIVIASDTISRSTFMQSISSNTNTICLSPVAPQSGQCVATTAGPELPPAAALTDYSRAAWYCAASSGTVANIIKGYRTRDKRDYGNISAPALQ